MLFHCCWTMYSKIQKNYWIHCTSLLWVEKMGTAFHLYIHLSRIKFIFFWWYDTVETPWNSAMGRRVFYCPGFYSFSDIFHCSYHYLIWKNLVRVALSSDCYYWFYPILRQHTKEISCLQNNSPCFCVFCQCSYCSRFDLVFCFSLWVFFSTC